MTTFEVVRRPDGKIKTRCQSCQTEVILDPGEEPFEEGSLAEKWGRIAASTMIYCEPCADKMLAAEQRASSQRGMATRLGDSGLPKPLRGMVFDEMIVTPAREPAIEAAKKWATSGGGLVLYGPTGSGKTRLAATAVYDRLHRGSCRWVSVAVLIAELGASFSDAGRREAVKVITGEHPLCLDDFDKVNPSEWARNQLFAAVDRRIQAGAPLLVTTNLRPAALRDKFGEALASRLAGCKTFELAGPDYRLTLDETL